MLIQMLNSMHARHIISRFFSISSRSDQFIVFSSSFIDRQNTWSWWLVRKCVKFIANATIVKTYRDLKWSRRKRRKWRRWRRRRRKLLYVYVIRKFTFLNRIERIIKTWNMRRYRVISYDERVFSFANFWTCMRCSLIMIHKRKDENVFRILIQS